MEIEAQAEAELAQQHLAQLDDAVKASTIELHHPGSAWEWLLIALMGPAAVFTVTVATGVADERFRTLLLVGAVLLWCAWVIGLIAITVRAQGLGVRPKAPVRGGPKPTTWVYAAHFSITLPMFVATSLVIINEVNRPFLLAGLLYVWLAIVPGYCYRRHAAESLERAL